MTRTAEISGGGIGGMALGALLARQGWRVRVHEQSPEIREAGAGIYIKNNSQEVLENLGVMDRIIDGGTRLERAQIRFASGEIRQERQLKGSSRVTTFPRQTLIEGLRDVALLHGVDIVTNSKVAGVRDGVLVMADDSRHAADLIVGADGVHSAVRTSLNIGGRFTELPTMIDRFMIAREFAPELMTIEHWAGNRRIGVTPAGPDNTYVYMVAPFKDQAAARLPLDVENWSGRFPKLRRMFEAIHAQPLTKFTQYPYGFVTCPKWAVGNVAIIGDAAHGLPPTLGQGGGLTLMNAFALASILRDAKDVPQALLEWERRVRFISDRTQAWSRRYDTFTRGLPESLNVVRSAVVWSFGAFPFLNNRMRIADYGLKLADIQVNPQINQGTR